MRQTPTSANQAATGPRIYRAFLLGEDGSIRSVTALEAETDEAARTIAAALVNGHGVELWERARFLARYPPRRATD